MSKFDPQKHHRRSIRLKGYDYAQPGAYFVTIVTQGRECLFGEIIDGQMRLNQSGHIIQATWQGLPSHYPHIQLDEFVVMPNHVHGIIVIVDDDHDRRGGSETRPYQTRPYAVTRHALPEIVRAFKSFSARLINQELKSPGTPLWQRNYYEHIIRNESEWACICLYIQNNPAQWDDDPENLGVNRPYCPPT